ncbi:Alg9-like mannosyltransferase family-domain-containing protein [Lentinula raphanica]|nr:Alg9-like mannosyltransferase family-domain-containing protein [Lentinula raphanica]
MNTYPLELIAQLGPVMFVAGLNQANQANTTNTSNSKSNTTNQTKGKKNDSNANTIRRPPPAAAGHRKHQSMSDTMNMNPALTPSSSSSSATSSTSASPSSSSPGPDAQGETPTAAEAEREVQGEGDTEGGEEVDDDGEAEAEMSQQQRGERERDPFALLASRLREMLLAQRRITVWDPPATGAATGVNGAEEKKMFQVVLVDKDVRFPPRKASLVGNDGDSSMSTSMSNVFPSSSSGLSTSSSSSSHTSSHSMSSFPSSSSSHQTPLLPPNHLPLHHTPALFPLPTHPYLPGLPGRPDRADLDPETHYVGPCGVCVMKEEMKEENPWNTPEEEEAWGESSASSSPSAPSDPGESGGSKLEESNDSDIPNTSTTTSNATTTSNISNTSTTTTSPNSDPTKELQESTITTATFSSNSPSTKQCQQCQQATTSTNIERAIALLVLTAVVFRAEVVLLLGPVVLQSLALGYVGFWRLVWVGIVVGLVSIATTVAVDSFFWRELVWPEAKGILFNVVEGNSSQWGTSPIYTYILLLLKLLLTSLPLSILGCFLNPTIREMLLPYVAFVGIISFLGHKEWRFVVYVVPVVNVGAARAGEWMTTQRNKSKSKKSTLLWFGFYGMILFNVVVTVGTTVASIGNYPGGEALRRFDELVVPAMGTNGRPYHVHIANLAAQSGASLFLQEHALPFPPSSLMSTTHNTDTNSPWYLSPPWVSSPNAPYTWTVYDKTENQTIDDLSRNTDITHLISEMSPVEMRSRMRIWKVVGAGLGGATGSGIAPSAAPSAAASAAPSAAASAAATGGAGGGSEDDIDVVYVDETKLVGVIYTTIPPGISEKALEVFEFGKAVAKGVGRVIKEGVRSAVRVLREALVQVFRGGVQNDEDKGKEAVGIMERFNEVLETMLETMEDLVGKVGWGWCWDWTEMGKSNWSWGGTASANESGNRKRSVSGWLKDAILMRGIMKRKPVLWIYGRR